MRIILLLALCFLVKSQDLVNNQNLTNEFNCLSNPLFSCSGTNGICISNGTFGFYCKCDKNFDSQNCPENVQCCNELEPRVKIFLLSFFVGYTGAPYFVLGMTGFGIGILLLCCLGCCCAGISGGFIKSDDPPRICYPIFIIAVLASLSASIWTLALWIMAAAETGQFDNEKIGSW